MADIQELIRLAHASSASDLHLVVDCSPMLRINGSLMNIDGMSPLSGEEIGQAFAQLTTPEQRDEFHRTLELDFSYSLPGIGRLRCNVAQQRGALSFALRLLPPWIPTIAGLELPEKTFSLSGISATPDYRRSYISFLV